MALVEVKVPDIGDFKDVEIIELLVKPGDTIKPEQSLVTVESDKASMEIPSSQSGVVKELKVKMGDKISEGTLLLMLEASGDAAAPASASAPASAPAPAAAATPAVAPAAPSPSAPAPAPDPAAGAAAPAPAPASGGGSTIDIVVPDIGDFDEVSVIEVLVKAGDTVAAEQSLITVESDKASMEIPAVQAGKVSEVSVKVGDKVKAGSVIGRMAASGGAGASAPAPASASAAASAPVSASAPAPAPASESAPASERVAPTAALPAHVPTEARGNLPHASPSVRLYARELGVPLTEVKGSGPKGRITQADVQGFVKSVMAGTSQTQAAAASAPKTGSGGGEGYLPVLAWPKVDFTKFGTVERKPLSRIKKISGANLHRNWVVIPHVTNHEDADITELEAFRVQLNKENEKAGIKITMLAFVLKACVAALRKFPDFNSSLDGDDLVLKKYFHMGFAADTPNGLVVPVIRDVDKKGLLQVAVEMNELAKKARDGKLGPAEMTGGSMSVSSLGGIGGTYFTPIINAPEVSILGLSKSAMKPVWDGKAFVPRLILPMSLSYDHRVIDGAAGARFNTYLSQVLTDFRRVIL